MNGFVDYCFWDRHPALCDFFNLLAERCLEQGLGGLEYGITRVQWICGGINVWMPELARVEFDYRYDWVPAATRVHVCIVFPQDFQVRRGRAVEKYCYLLSVDGQEASGYAKTSKAGEKMAKKVIEALDERLKEETKAKAELDERKV